MVLFQDRVLSLCYQWKNTQQQTEKLLSAEHVAKIIQHKSQKGRQAGLKMFKTSSMKYLQIHKFPFKNNTIQYNTLRDKN